MPTEFENTHALEITSKLLSIWSSGAEDSLITETLSPSYFNQLGYFNRMANVLSASAVSLSIELVEVAGRLDFRLSS